MNDNTIRKLLSDYGHAHRTATETLRRERSTVKRTIRRLKSLAVALSVVQDTAEEVQNYVHQRVSELVTKCLRAVFDDLYEFRIDFVKKRNKTDAVCRFVKRGVVLSAKDVGGGVLDVTSFALRLACLSLQSPRPRKLLIADEPFKYVSSRKMYRERVKVLLETLAEEMGFQFILVTHDVVLEIGKIVEINP